MKEFIKHLVISSYDQRLPYFLQSIGCKEHQKSYNRPGGYPYFHWLQTFAGKGEFVYGEQLYVLEPGDGILLAPDVPHRYEAVTDQWSTLFLTFGGSMVQSVLSALGLQQSNYYRLSNSECLVQLIDATIHKLKTQTNATGLDLSTDLYQFLVFLKKYGHSSNFANMQTHEPLNQLLQWMDEIYSDPHIRLSDMANLVHISKQHLMSLFRNRFGISPYAYLIQLRINKSKELFALRPELAVKEVAGRMGFNDVSHFVATFKRLEKMTPETFKNMFTNSNEKDSCSV